MASLASRAGAAASALCALLLLLPALLLLLPLPPSATWLRGNPRSDTGAALRSAQRRLAVGGEPGLAAAAGNVTALARADLSFGSGHGYLYTASSTRYGPTHGACGGVDTRKLVEGTGYIAVASAQAMQPVFAGQSACGWQCFDADESPVEFCDYSQCASNFATKGCHCRQTGACWCGEHSAENGPHSGTAPMGCFTCARARFFTARPYDSNLSKSAERGDFASKEVKVVVADSCPYGPNSQWCPARPGDTNSCGMKNHLDFTAYPPGVDNNFVAFTPEPCSEELQARIDAMSTCKR